MQTQGRNVDVVNVHTALCRLENTEERECERRFACARATHDADALTGAGLERYIAQHGLQIRAVLRRVVTELHHTARRPRWRRLRLWNMSLTLHRQARVRHHALYTHDVLLDLGSRAHSPVECLRRAEHLREHQTQQTGAHTPTGGDHNNGHGRGEQNHE